MKKKIITVISMLMIASSLFAGSFIFGASGKGAMNGNNSWGGLSVHGGYSFFEEPYLTLSTSITLSPYFESVGLKLSTEPVSLLRHPFDFAFTNKTLWSPKLSVGADYVMDSGFVWSCEISPLNFRDTDFEYEFLSPMITFSTDFSDIGFGFTVMRFTRFY